MSNTVLSYRNWLHESDSSALSLLSNIVSGAPLTDQSTMHTPQLSDATLFHVVASGTVGDLNYGDIVIVCSPRVAAVEGVGVVPRPINMAGLLGVIIPDLLDDAGDPAKDFAGMQMRVIVNTVGAPYDSDWMTVAFNQQDRMANHFLHSIPGTHADGANVEIHLRLLFDAAGAEVDVAVGGVWIGPVFSTEHGLESNWSITPMDSSKMQVSRGNQGYPEIVTRVREFSGQWAPMDFVSAFGNPDTPNEPDAQRVMSHLGNSGFSVLLPRTQTEAGDYSTHIVRRLGMYGYFSDLGRLNEVGGNNFAWGPFTFRELL